MTSLARTRALSALLVLTLVAPFVTAQDRELEEGLRFLLDNALEIQIGLHVGAEDQSVSWNSQRTEVTIPGRSVDVHLTGENLRVEAFFTPYVDAAGNITLVAQGRVWLADAAGQAVNYSTTYRSVPIGIGEKLLFFPLGVAEQLADEVTLRLEVEIAPFTLDSAQVVIPEAATDQT
jgi:hypothetical protein